MSTEEAKVPIETPKKEEEVNISLKEEQVIDPPKAESVKKEAECKEDTSKIDQGLKEDVEMEKEEEVEETKTPHKNGKTPAKKNTTDKKDNKPKPEKKETEKKTKDKTEPKLKKEFAPTIKKERKVDANAYKDAESLLNKKTARKKSSKAITKVEKVEEGEKKEK